ncbi:MAG TPA: hypothetical protein VN616_04965 [Puia sp.]|nr:hypothetical protein [Puia sp.]
MNRILCCAVLAIGLGCASKSSAQTFDYHFSPDNESLTANVPLNEISARAFRNFVKSYGYIPGAIWHKREGGYSVMFHTPDSVLYVVHYSTHGRPCDTHVFYTAKNAPPAVSMAVKNVYGRGDILFVTKFDDGVKAIFEIGLLQGDRLRVVEDKNGDVNSVQVFNQYGITSRPL